MHLVCEELTFQNNWFPWNQFAISFLLPWKPCSIRALYGKVKNSMCFTITVSLCSLLKTSFMLTFCFQFCCCSGYCCFFIKKFSVLQKNILYQQNKLFHKGNRTIVPRIIALQFTTDNYIQVITSRKLPPDNGSQINGFHVIVPR